MKYKLYSLHHYEWITHQRCQDCLGYLGEKKELRLASLKLHLQKLFTEFKCQINKWKKQTNKITIKPAHMILDTVIVMSSSVLHSIITGNDKAGSKTVVCFKKHTCFGMQGSTIRIFFCLTSLACRLFTFTWHMFIICSFLLYIYVYLFIIIISQYLSSYFCKYIFIQLLFFYNEYLQ